QRVIGDHIANFAAGEVLFIGPNLPHYMRNDAAFYQGREELRCRAIVAHFAQDFLGPGFFAAPELSEIQYLLRSSAQGVRVLGETAAIVGQGMEDLLHLRGYDRLMKLLDLLIQIARTDDWQTLASQGYTQQLSGGKQGQIGEVFAYLFANYTQEIRLPDLAERLNLSESAFCKLIKRHTGKTFTGILNEVRVGQACRLLIESNLQASEIAYACGYSSPAYFNRRFREIMDCAPLQYRQQFGVG
ncbi:MAG: AraC family transcriptional regulator, partial [Bacteroidota bacterium]